MSRLAKFAAALALVSGLLAVGAGIVLRSVSLAAPYRLILVLIPILPMAMYCLLCVRIVHELDELQSRIQLEGAVYGLLGTALLTMTGGPLVKGGIIPPVDLAAVWPWLWMAAFLLWAAGSDLARRRYQ